MESYWIVLTSTSVLPSSSPSILHAMPYAPSSFLPLSSSSGGDRREFRRCSLSSLLSPHDILLFFCSEYTYRKAEIQSSWHLLFYGKSSNPLSLVFSPSSSGGGRTPAGGRCASLSLNFAPSIPLNWLLCRSVSREDDRNRRNSRQPFLP